MNRQTSPLVSRELPATPRATLPLLLDISKVAMLTGLSQQTLRNWLWRGVLPFPTVQVGARRLVRTEDLLAWVASLRGSEVAHVLQAHLGESQPASSVRNQSESSRRGRGRPRGAVAGSGK